MRESVRMSPLENLHAKIHQLQEKHSQEILSYFKQSLNFQKNFFGNALMVQENTSIAPPRNQ